MLDGNRDCVSRVDRGAYELTGQAAAPAACAPPPGATGGPGALDRAPILKRVSFSRRRFRVSGRKRGTEVGFRLSEKARVTMAVDQLRRGRKPSKRGWLTFKGRAGANTKTFKGRLSGQALPPARYRARLRARDDSGKRSTLRIVTFRILPARG